MVPLLSGDCGLFGLMTPAASSTLVSLCKKLLSFTGLLLVAPATAPPLVVLFTLLEEPLPFILVPEGELAWGMFSGRGCSLPIEVTPPSLALPALDIA